MRTSSSTFFLASAVLLSITCMTRSAENPPANYQVTTAPSNIAPTVATRTTTVPVAGEPRNSKAHPNVFWDQDDVDHYKEMLKTNKELQLQLAELKAQMDTRIAMPIAIPGPKKGPDGKWLFPGEYFPPFPGRPNDDPVTRFRVNYSQDGQDISDLGTIYALTGEEKYADYAKQLMLCYAHCYEWSGGPNIRLRSAQGICVQLLEETLIMDHFVRGYDLIYNLPSWTADERKQLHDEFFYPMACVYLYPAACDIDKVGGGSFCSQVNNRGLIGLTSVLAMGYVSDDQQLIDAALYGIHTPLKRPDNAELTHFVPRQDWVPATKDDPGHGLLNTYFGPQCLPGGMWVEGTPSYAFYALGSMIDAAEICWHHGIDLYRNNNAIFKNMFDFPILLSYPDLTTPGLNDAHRDSIRGGFTPTFYEYGYRRYQDPRYLAIINAPGEREYLKALNDPASAALLAPPAPYGPTAPKPVKPAPAPTTEPAGDAPAPAAPPAKLLKSMRHLELYKIGSMPPAFMYDLDPNAGATIPPSPSVNYPDVGYGILRTPTADGSSLQCLTLSSGPTASHGHPDKLQIDLYALNDVLMPSPGINFPYNNNFRIAKWYHTTIGHNTLTVDEKSQEYYGNNPRSKARADQIIFAPAATIGLQRANTDLVYPGVTMDRSIFMTPNYVADIFGAFSATPHKYDLAWHVRGQVSSELKFTPIKFDKNINGYNWFTKAATADAGDKPFAVAFDRDGNIARLHVAGVSPTTALLGEGGIYVDDTSSDPTHKPTCPTIIERRDDIASTIYGNALDYSGSKDGYVKGVTQEGSLDTGYAMLRVTTADGTDLCFAAFRPGDNKPDGLQTDAMQALVRMNGAEVQSLYLAGGKSLKSGNASIERSDAGLSYIEKTQDGKYIVGNSSPSDATVTVTLPALAGLKAFNLDDSGKQAGPAAVTGSADHGLILQLKANSKVEFIKG